MSTDPAAPTDEPSSRLSNQLSRSPDEDAGKATPAENGSRGLVMTAPRSLSAQLPSDRNPPAHLHPTAPEPQGVAFSDH
ncbi:hypothetical protein NBRC10512_001198 [Rhodotorula toruloides]|uniref:RHTO0S06e04214g1_1 n=2 Tax=Rhodotorula toruloides TaxID=5286 RepID=A0A061AVT4_RHOTO|nr:uncharacterized protein RHTO_06178 [Rhodotorula toruloides NP11]EMS24174.1 hypothetical protein RHTO_06178 [Rhodotorula toruloides NP11]CDR41684.1 RHTO0S06e04214g1_1 [Rhodotorula toruloides]